MYLSGMCFACGEKSTPLGSLGMDWWSIAAAALSTASNQKGGGASAQPGNITTTTVTTGINTSISPQISPQFIQQDSPEDSAVNAASIMMPNTSQSTSADIPQSPYGSAGIEPVGYTPRTGSIPGMDYGGYLPASMQPASSVSMPIILAAGAGLILLAVVLKKKKT